MLARAALACILVASLSSVACATPAVLANTHSSDDALAQAVLDAMERRDVDALMRLSVSEEEFERVVWPSLPASRPEVGVSSSYVWQDTFTKSRAYLHRTLQQWGGKRLQLIRVEFAGDTTEGQSYSLSRKSRLVVRDEEGHERTVRLFGSIIRQAGQSKVYSFILD